MSMKSIVISLTVIAFLFGVLSDSVSAVPVSSLVKSLGKGLTRIGYVIRPKDFVRDKIIRPFIRQRQNSLRHIELTNFIPKADNSVDDQMDAFKALVTMRDQMDEKEIDRFIDTWLDELVDTTRHSVKEEIGSKGYRHVLTRIDDDIERELKFLRGSAGREFRKRTKNFLRGGEYHTGPDQFLEFYRIARKRADVHLDGEICIGSAGLSFSLAVGEASVKVTTSGSIVVNDGRGRSVSVPLKPDYPYFYNLERADINSFPELEDLRDARSPVELNLYEICLYYGLLGDEFFVLQEETAPVESANSAITSELCLGRGGALSFSVGGEDWSTKITTTGKMSFTQAR